MKTVCIVQARMTSTRLPGKSMMPIMGFPLIEHVLTRCILIVGVDQVVLAIPDSADSDELEVPAERVGIPVFRGPEHDVLKRYALAAKKYEADVICRITGDCPLIDPIVASLVLKPVLDGAADYCSNVHPRTYEKGLDVEVFTRWALAVADRDAKAPKQREHVTPFMVRNKIFRRKTITSSIDRDKNTNWSVDTIEDLEAVRNEFAKRYAVDATVS